MITPFTSSNCVIKKARDEAPDDFLDTKLRGKESSMYSPEFKKKALRIIDKHGGSCIKASRELGVVCPRTLRRWRDESKKKPRRRYAHLSRAQKRSIARQFQQGTSAAILSERYGVCVTSIYNIRNEYRQMGEFSFMDRKETIEVPKIDPAELPNDIEQLKKRCAELELDNAILEQTIEILKKDPGVDPSDLSNTEKMMVIDALGARFSVSELCGKLRIARSSYYYSKTASQRPDPHAATRARIRTIFERSRSTFGAERIWHALRGGDDGLEPVIISEKIVRRLMKEEGLVVIYNKRRRSYSSYKGEISEHPGNKVCRNFHADAPDMLWLTDITQFTLPDYKCYLSAIIDCFDGKVVSHRLSRIPDADLANSTLIRAAESIGVSRRPILHSDCGCHYRWSGWIDLCERYGIARSMSKKACSPDNAACEAFFGRLKNEFFHYRDWSGVSYEEFSGRLDRYIDYYNNGRRKKSLGWLSPTEYRKSLGYAA